jgi:hypothetical protein
MTGVAELGRAGPAPTDSPAGSCALVKVFWTGQKAPFSTELSMHSGEGIEREKKNSNAHRNDVGGVSVVCKFWI